jgi:GT2 family glycosyltransferase
MEEKIDEGGGVTGGTSNMSYKKSVLDEVGGFDEGFLWPAGEDIDLKMRVCKRGKRVLYIPVGVTHNREYTFRSFIAQAKTRGLGGRYFRAKYGKENKVDLSLRILLSPLLFIRSSWEYKRRCGSWHVKIAIIKTIGVIYSSIQSLL